jgi:KUP system potassium uptake protein
MKPLPRGSKSMALSIGALGVVYGDIGTSPLYALRECFHGSHAMPVTEANVLGLLSLFFWALTLIVSVKYIGFVMCANHKGEGGILALVALAAPEQFSRKRVGFLLMACGVFGAGLLYGDGILTPALTVLSAVEGLAIATPSLSRFIVPITLLILIVLFYMQRHGTGRMGAAFGPIMVVWFVTLSALGLRQIVHVPAVLQAINPYYAVAFMLEHGRLGFFILGAVFLVVTGAEALYADMGHFGPRPIRQAWFVAVFPALVLNYFGQGALLLRHPDITHPFFQLAPEWGRFPLVMLSTLAAVIASQALISGVFSLTLQSVQLGLLPRVSVHHTSPDQRGQVYIPKANWGLLAACMLLVISFGSSSGLAAAYGIAVSLTMVISSLLFGVVARRVWKWNWITVFIWLAFFLSIEFAFLGANLAKIGQGGWVPLVMALLVFVVMWTWRSGRQQLREIMYARCLPLSLFLADEGLATCARVPGTAVFMTGNPDIVPLSLLHNIKHNHVLHRRNILLSLRPSDEAKVHGSSRLTVEKLSDDFYRVIGTYGYMDQPHVPRLLAACAAYGLECDPLQVSYFVSSETIVSTRAPGMMRWRKKLFGVLSRNAERATAFFSLPANRVVELGMQVRL